MRGVLQLRGAPAPPASSAVITCALHL